MSALARSSDPLFRVAGHPGDITQLMDEHHLVACSTDGRRRAQFGAMLSQFISTMRDAQVVSLQGRAITDLESFCGQLERALPGPALERRVNGPSGVVNLLRHRQTFGLQAPAKFRFYIWHDADTLLRSDPMLFGHLVEAVAGVAAEAEYVCDDLLLIHRALLIGGPDLEAYADLPNGQCRSWVHDDDEPFWQVVTGIEQPSFIKYDIDAAAS